MNETSNIETKACNCNKLKKEDIIGVVDSVVARIGTD